MAERDTSSLATLFMFGVGLGALGLAFVAALYSVGIDGTPDDVVLEWNGHLVGGPMDILVAKIIAFVLGTAGVACVLRTWKDVRDAAFRPRVDRD